MIVDILQVELVEQKPPLAGLVPTYFEFEFKDLVLKGRTKEVLLRGKVDRIDVTPDGEFALVIDYKTGKPFYLKALENGTALQLPLYLIAVGEKLGLKPLGAHLYSLTDAASKGIHHREHLELAGISTQKRNRLTAEEFNAVIDRSVAFVERFTSEIEASKIPVRPRDCVVYCPYAALCRIEKWRLKHIYREIAEAEKSQMWEKANNGREGEKEVF